MTDLFNVMLCISTSLNLTPPAAVQAKLVLGLFAGITFFTN